jgi:hypothetical protein
MSGFEDNEYGEWSEAYKAMLAHCAATGHQLESHDCPGSRRIGFACMDCGETWYIYLTRVKEACRMDRSLKRYMSAYQGRVKLAARISRYG